MSGKRTIEKSFRAHNVDGLTVKAIGAQCYEIWDGWGFGARYLCLLSSVDGKWGATHNAKCDGDRAIHADPYRAVMQYRHIAGHDAD